MLTVPLEFLHISPLRPAVPLPWPTAQAVHVARTLGFVDPITVRPLSAAEPPRYEILSGLRFWLLAQRAHLERVPILVRAGLSDADARPLVEQDAGLGVVDPIAEARTVRDLVERQGSIAAAGRVLGWSRAEASNRLRLLQLCPAVQAQVAAGTLEPGKARALIGLDEAAQIALAQRIGRERLNTRQVEVLARARKPGSAPLAETTPAPPGKDPNVARLENELAELVGSPVTIHAGEGGRGQLIIDFDNLEILDGVLARLGYVP